jgi:chromosome segregation ATPase
MPRNETAAPEATPARLDEVELRRRIRDVAQQVGRLETDRRALSEVLSALTAEDEALERQVQRAEREQATLEERIARERGRTAEVEAELAAVRREIPELEQRCAEQIRRGEEVSRQCEAVRDEVAGLEQAFAVSKVELRTLRDSLSRRLHHTREKR